MEQKISLRFILLLLLRLPFFFFFLCFPSSFFLPDILHLFHLLRCFLNASQFSCLPFEEPLCSTCSFVCLHFVGLMLFFFTSERLLRVSRRSVLRYRRRPSHYGEAISIRAVTHLGLHSLQRFPLRE